MIMIGAVIVLYQLVAKYRPAGFQYIYIGTTTGKRIIKIGISRNPKVRESFINESIKGSTQKIVFQARTFFAYSLEQWLHKKYHSQRSVYKGSGRTEWFRMSFFTRLWVLCLMIGASLFSALLLTAAGVFIGYQIVNLLS